MNKRRYKKRNFRQLFRHCTTAQKPVYTPIDIILNVKRYVSLMSLRFLKNASSTTSGALCVISRFYPVLFYIIIHK
jgi:hypothetical protein